MPNRGHSQRPADAKIDHMVGVARGLFVMRDFQRSTARIGYIAVTPAGRGWRRSATKFDFCERRSERDLHTYIQLHSKHQAM